MKHLTEMENEVLSKFFIYIGRKVETENAFLGNIQVSDRSQSPKGWMTTLSSNNSLRLTDSEMLIDWSEFACEAVLNKTIPVGFVVFARSGIITAIEGYSYGDEWPEVTNSVEFLK